MTRPGSRARSYASTAAPGCRARARGPGARPALLVLQPKPAVGHVPVGEERRVRVRTRPGALAGPHLGVEVARSSQSRSGSADGVAPAARARARGSPRRRLGRHMAMDIRVVDLPRGIIASLVMVVPVRVA